MVRRICFLRDAIENKHTAVTKLLLTNGSKVNSKNKKPSNTPLHFAAINGDIEIVKMLLDRGANIDAKISMAELRFTMRLKIRKWKLLNYF
ncbi:UNVERIFIED_CONTAM: ankyrin repeat domain-containing protein [Wolbachia endosymbiont of Nasonia longicornis]